MRVGVIDVTNLVSVRKTFNPVWRSIITLISLLFVGLWWAAIHQIANLTGADGLRTYTFLLTVLLLPAFGVALFRKDDFARFCFVLISIFIIFTMLLLLILAIYGVTLLQSDVQIILALVGILLLLNLVWTYIIQYSYALCLSVIPIKRWRAYRKQVILSLRLWSGHWKSSEEPDGYRANRGRRPEPGALWTTLR